MFGFLNRLWSKKVENESLSSHGVCEDKVREKAYLKWEAAGYPVSDGVEFWLAAEEEIEAETEVEG